MIPHCVWQTSGRTQAVVFLWGEEEEEEEVTNYREIDVRWAH